MVGAGRVAAADALRGRLRAQFQGQTVLIGVDDMDVFKGIELKLQALGQVLDHHPEWRGRLTLLQVTNAPRCAPGPPPAPRARQPEAQAQGADAPRCARAARAARASAPPSQPPAAELQVQISCATARARSPAPRVLPAPLRRSEPAAAAAGREHVAPSTGPTPPCTPPSLVSKIVAGKRVLVPASANVSACSPGM